MKPTEAQLGLLFKWFRWQMPNDRASAAIKWLENHATRKDVSAEIARVHDLYHGRRLDERRCFDSEIWRGYLPKEGE